MFCFAFLPILCFLLGFMALHSLKENNILVYPFVLLTIFFGSISLYSILNAPVDYLQGAYSKIMYIHVPSAWLSLFIFLAIAFFSTLYLIFKNPMYDLLAKSLAPIGLIYNFSALFTGALWGKPTWGVYWVWDARLTSMFIQFCIYMAYMLLRNINSDERKASYSAALFAVFSVVNIPIIKFSVYIWNTLHQKSTIVTLTGPKIHTSMLWPLITSSLTFLMITVLALILQARLSLLKKKVK